MTASHQQRERLEQRCHHINVSHLMVWSEFPGFESLFSKLCLTQFLLKGPARTGSRPGVLLWDGSSCGRLSHRHSV